MKVAIIGAGKAGLACAHELEKYNIRPVVYERNSYIGEQWGHAIATMEIAQRPVKDALKYFNDHLGINIKPLNTLNRVIHISPNKTTVIRGNLGYLYKSDRDTDSVKYQIYSKLKNTQVLFNEIGDYEQLMKEYDHVVVATGNPSFSEELGCWQKFVRAYVRGATVLGNFDPNTLIVWLNKDYCKNGYAYLTPFNHQKASINLITTDVDEKEIDYYWELFLYGANIQYEIIEGYKLEHNLGIAYPRIYKNLILTGNAAGGADPFLGFGLYNALTMGVAAARTIAKGWDYEKQIKGVIQRNLQLKRFRKAFNNLNNKDYDNLITAIGLPGIRHLIYGTSLNITKTGALAISLMERLKSMNNKN